MGAPLRVTLLPVRGEVPRLGWLTAVFAPPRPRGPVHISLTQLANARRV